jgi:hypothetical protein
MEIMEIMEIMQIKIKTAFKKARGKKCETV